MTAPEYIQLKAFARIDGALLSLLWVSSFFLYIIGLASPHYGVAAMALAVLTPFFAGSRLRRFRDNGLEGTISFLRAWAYVILMFFYGGLLFALVQWAYFTYMDHGYLVKAITQMMAEAETTEALLQLGMGESLNESMQMLAQMRPIDLSLNILSTNIMIGIALGMPIAALMRKRGVRGEK